MEQFLQQLGMEDLRSASFSSAQEFESLYFRTEEAPSPQTATPQPEAAEPPEEAKTEGDAESSEGADLKLFSEVHLVIFAMDSIGEKPKTWLPKLKRGLKKFKHWPQENPTRIVMLKYEDDGVEKLDVIDPLLDDLIYAPIDRLVFLQKLEILINLPKKIKASFLFTQEVKQDIEISKITRLEKLSDVGLAIRNPVRLKKGLPGHFYVLFPGEKTPTELFGKVFRSDPHPEIEGQFLVYFSYFGLPKNTLTTIRRVLSRAGGYHSLKNESREDFRYNPDSLFNDENTTPSLGVAVIDPDNHLAVQLTKQLTKDMDRLAVNSESSYSLFLHKYFEPTGSSEQKSPPRATEESDFYKQPIQLSVSASDQKVLGVNPGPEVGDLFLGHAAIDLFGSPEKWFSLITDKGSRLVLEEAALMAAKGKTLEKLVVFQDGTDARRAINLRITPGEAEHLVKYEIKPANLTDIVDKMTSDLQKKELDLILIDSGFVPEDPEAWIEGLRLRALQLGVTKTHEQLKFIVTVEPDAPINPVWLKSPNIMGLIVKPVDNRQLMFNLSEALRNENTVYHFDNLGWAEPRVPIHIAKECQLETLSEYGAVLKVKSPMVAGTMVYLRKSIFENAPNQCLASRVYVCEEHPSEKGYFQLHTSYFGIADQFLKFARTWIRENYAAQKNLDGGG